MLVVAAVGGNALLRRGERPDVETQRHHVAEAAGALAPVARAHSLVVTHGNGPQIGLLATQAAATRDLAPPPLDVLDAETEGLIGYLSESERAARRPGRDVAGLLTRVVVDAADPAFADPTKPIGVRYERAAAEELAATLGWTVRPEGYGPGAAWRRVVPSPAPLEVLERRVVEVLLAAHVVPICLGGGGIPVVRDGHGGFRGVEAVVDKDAASALLAVELGADRLLLLTDVPAVEADFGTAAARPLGRVTVDELAALTFPPGSMGPKVAAACAFVRATGGQAVIGELAAASRMVDGEVGTVVVAAPAAARAKEDV
ncbi:MAG: carbamate kinase [Acidimicrobiia bacterium]